MDKHDGHNHEHLIEVTVLYPTAHHPAEKEFEPTTPLSEVKQFALDTFHLSETNEGGNQVVFFLYLERKKIEDLNQPLSTISGERQKVHLRLVKEIVAG